MANQDDSSKSEQRSRQPLTASPWVRALLWTVGVALVLLVCGWLSDIVIPLLLAILAAYMFDPVIGRLERRRLPRTVAIAVVIVALMAAVTLVVVTVAVTSVEDAQRVAGRVASFKQKVGAGGSKLQTDVTEWIKESNYSDRIVEVLQDNINQAATYIADLGSVAGTTLFAAVTQLGRGAVWFVGAGAKTLLFAIVAFYLLKDFGRFKSSMLRLVPMERRERIVAVTGKIDELLHGFFRGQMLISLTLAGIYAIGLSLLGIPFALIIAIVGGLANIVPYMGLVLGLLPAALLAIVAFGDLWHPAGVVVVFIVGQAIEGTVLTPRIMGRSTNLHPVTVILSILVFARIFGFVGLLLAVPASAVIKVVAGEAFQSYQAAAAPEPEHQRRSNRRRPRRRRRPASSGDRSRQSSKPSTGSQPNRRTDQT